MPSQPRPPGDLLRQQDQLALPQLPTQCHHLPHTRHESPAAGVLPSVNSLERDAKFEVISTFLRLNRLTVL